MEPREVRKQAQKRVSSVHPQLSSLPKEKRNKEEFNRDLAAWLNVQESPWVGLTGFLYFRSLFYFKEPDYLIVLREMVEDLSDDLLQLYFRYGILPKPVLEILQAFIEADFEFDRISWNRLRSRKARVKDAKLLEKAEKVLEQYEPFLPPQPENVYPALMGIANQIRDLSPSQRHRPKNLTLILFARELAEHFFSLTGRSLYEYVGKLLVAAFPDKWNPSGQIKDATIKLVNAGNGAEDDIRYFAELLSGHVDKAISMAAEYWGKKRKQVDKQLKARMTRRPRKARGGIRVVHLLD